MSLHTGNQTGEAGASWRDVLWSQLRRQPAPRWCGLFRV